MAKVGLLTCSNCTRDLGCSSFLCLRDVRHTGGMFQRWSDQGGAELVGIISCAGCPTAVGPERLLSRVRSLTELGVDGIHVSSCMKAVCPFVNKYLSLMREAFPEVEIVVGSHTADRAEEVQFKGMVKQMLCQPQVTMADHVRRAPAQ